MMEYDLRIPVSIGTALYALVTHGSNATGCIEKAKRLCAVTAHDELSDPGLGLLAQQTSLCSALIAVKLTGSHVLHLTCMPLRLCSGVPT